MDSGGAQGDFGSVVPSLSPDGRFVAFQSLATNLVTGDTNGFYDTFVRDRQSGATERVSVDSGGAEGNGHSGGGSHPGGAAMSGDGRFVVFQSEATNLVAGDTNGNWDVFVRDRQVGTTERVSVSTNGAQGNSGGTYSSISFDGRFVAFHSFSSNLVAGDTNGSSDVFVRDRQTATTERVSVHTNGWEGTVSSAYPSMSADGRFVAFSSRASNLVGVDTNGWVDVFVRDRQVGSTELASVTTSGAQGNFDSVAPCLSADGRFVGFASLASNFVAGDSNGSHDVFVHDRQSGTTERASVATGGAQGNSDSVPTSISGDGRFVAFYSNAWNLVAGDTNTSVDVFLRDRQRRTTERVSVATGGAQANSGSQYVSSMSVDGRFIAFETFASNLVASDTNSAADVFVRDRGEPPIVAACFGDGAALPCPCGNSGLPGHGCENSSSTGGAVLSASGSPSLSADTLALTSSGEKPEALSIFLQGSAWIAPVVYGDGLRCVGGALKRLYDVNASGGIATAPLGGHPPISVRSAAIGDPIPMGATRHYQTYYRDGNPGFCPSPPGNTWNVSNALSAVWSP